MEGSHEVTGHLVSHVQERARLYVVVILVFSYHFLFEHELLCSCENPERDCAANMLLPALVIFLAMLWTDQRCQRAVCHKRGCSTMSRMSHALFVSLFWPVSALVDADWTICCFSQAHRNISCVEEDHLSEEDHRILNGLKDDSILYGLSTLLFMFFLALILSLIQKNMKRCPEYNWEEMVLEEGDKFVPEKMREVAKFVLLDKLKDHIPKHNWEECFRVGEEVLRDPPSAETLSRIATVVTGAASQDKVTPANHVESPSSSTGAQSHSDTVPLLSQH